MLKIVVLALATLAVVNSEAPKEYPGFEYIGSYTSSEGIGVYNSGNYYYRSSLSTWDQAFSSCQSLGTMSNLVTLEFFEEEKVVRGFMQQAQIPQTWTSGFAHQGVWKWSDGSLISYMNRINWLYGVPPATTDSFIYLQRGQTVLDDGWDAFSKVNMLPYICETSG